MADPRVLIMGVDIWEKGYISNIIDIKEYKTFNKDKLLPNEISFEVDNYDNTFSIDHPRSMFHGSRWKYGSVQIYNEDEILIWDALLKDISRDHSPKKTAKIVAISKLWKYRDKLIDYVSDAWETPATAFKNICDSIGFTNYNNKAITDSEAIFVNNNCYVKCNFINNRNSKFPLVIEKLANISVSDCYSHLGNIYFKHWKPYTGGVKKYLTDDDFLVKPRVYSLDADLINNYAIRYDDDDKLPAIDEHNNNVGEISRKDEYNGVKDLPAIDGSEDSQIIIKDKVSAVYLGNTHIKRRHIDLATQPRAPWMIDFDLEFKHRDWIDLDSFCRVSLDGESWENKLFEISNSNISNRRKRIILSAWEVQESAG